MYRFRLGTSCRLRMGTGTVSPSVAKPGKSMLHRSFNAAMCKGEVVRRLKKFSKNGCILHFFPCILVSGILCKMQQIEMDAYFKLCVRCITNAANNDTSANNTIAIITPPAVVLRGGRDFSSPPLKRRGGGDEKSRCVGKSQNAR